MYKEKYLKYKTKYLDLKNQLGGGPTAAELQLKAAELQLKAKERKQSAEKAQIELELLEIKKAIQIAERQLSNTLQLIKETEGRLAEAQEKKEKKKENMLQIVDDTRKQLIKVVEEQKDKNKFELSPHIIELEELITKLLEKGYTDKRIVQLSLDAIKKQEVLAKVETTLEAQKQPITLQEALVKLYRVLQELLLDIQIEEMEQSSLVSLKSDVQFRHNVLIALLKKKAQVIKEKMTIQLLENGNLLLNDYLQIGSDDSDDTEQLINIINPTEQFYKQNNFTGDMLAKIKKNVFIVLKKLFEDYYRHQIFNVSSLKQQIINLPVGILINFIEKQEEQEEQEEQIYVIIQETQYSYQLMKSNSYFVKKLSEFVDNNDISRKVSLNLYSILMHNLINCLEESKNVIELLTNNNILLSEIEAQIKNIQRLLYGR
jgi:hypothetical protein